MTNQHIATLTENECRELLFNTIRGGSFLMVNKVLLKILGADAALYLSHLIGWEHTYSDEKKLQKDGSFFKDREETFRETYINHDKQRIICKNLVELGLISIKKKQIPPRNFYIINHIIIFNMIKTVPHSPEIKGYKALKSRDIISNNKLSNNKVLSKDNTEAFSGKTQSFKTNALIDEWNCLREQYPMLRQHKDPSTKIYKSIIRIIKHLKFGTFGNMCHIDPDFRERNHISNKLLSKKWTEKEISETISKLALLFKNGYWPIRKDTLPKDLHSLLFNPRTNTSMFLLVYTHPPKPLSQEKTDKEIDNEIAFKKAKNKPLTEDELAEMMEKKDEADRNEILNHAKKRRA